MCMQCFDADFDYVHQMSVSASAFAVLDFNQPGSGKTLSGDISLPLSRSQTQHHAGDSNRWKRCIWSFIIQNNVDNLV